MGQKDEKGTNPHGGLSRMGCYSINEVVSNASLNESVMLAKLAI